MNKEERKLLYKDLCSRLPYGVKVDVSAWDSTSEEECIRNWGMTKQEINTLRLNPMFLYDKDLPKPYLRPLSSMTEDEIEEYVRLRFQRAFEVGRMRHICGNSIGAVVGTRSSIESVRYWYNDIVSVETIDFLLSHHLDWRGLIEMDLAIEAPSNMYEIEKGGDK